MKEALWIEGGYPLRGTLRISGSKNATLPLLAATLLTEEPCYIEGVPDVQDIRIFLKVIEGLGGDVDYDPHARSVRIEARQLHTHCPSENFVKKMRASVLMMGSLLARLGMADVALPGGCSIGSRPIDQHLKGFQVLGAEVSIQEGWVGLRARRLEGGRVCFDVPSVTGTENLLMAASLAKGETVIENAALEPEIGELSAALQKMGVEIEGIGSSQLRVLGRDRLGGFKHRVCRDRIEAATYTIAAALIGEEVRLEGVPLEHMESVLKELERIGIEVKKEGDGLRVAVSSRLKPCRVATSPYPGFPTDVQAQLMVLLTQVPGTSTIEERVFENRLRHAFELQRMGAAIEVEGVKARITGPSRLKGERVLATDLRASACLVLAGLISEGKTFIDGVHHLDRGYERMEEKLASLGARIGRIGVGEGLDQGQALIC